MPISALVFRFMNSQSDWFQQECISCRLHLKAFPGWHSKPQSVGSFSFCHQHETFGFSYKQWKKYVFPVQSSLPASLGFSWMAIRADYEIITLHNSASLPLSDGLFWLSKWQYFCAFLNVNIFWASSFFYSDTNFVTKKTNHIKNFDSRSSLWEIEFPQCLSKQTISWLNLIIWDFMSCEL